MKIPRIMLAAPASGSGKTLVTCGVLQALQNRGLKVRAFKCGPDYIDPMFHGRVLGIPSRNLDTFFTDENTTRYLLGKEAESADLSVMEGVMGFYDGVAGISTKASAYDLAGVTQTPVVLIVDARGMSLSVAALLKGFLEFRRDSGIAGVILNRISAGLYPRMKAQIEQELQVKVLGYVPAAEEYVIESRHLGLVTPDEIGNLKEKLLGLARVLEETVDINGLIALANEAGELVYEKPKIPRLFPTCFRRAKSEDTRRVRIGVARDEAFCFFYQDNLDLMEEMGAKLCYFSPLSEERLPCGLQGLIFYGGYPELYAKELSKNRSMIREIQKAIGQGVPYLAECGGFLYLHEFLEDMEGNSYPMVGAVKGRAYRTSRLGRFGYVTLEAKKEQLLGEQGAWVKGHEFHYFDSTENGEAFYAQKPMTGRGWDCMHGDGQRAVGFPHLYYYSNPQMIFRFLHVCKERGK